MQVTRTVNGLPGGDDELSGYRITHARVIGTLYSALRRANRENPPSGEGASR